VLLENKGQVKGSTHTHTHTHTHTPILTVWLDFWDNRNRRQIWVHTRKYIVSNTVKDTRIRI